MASLNSPRVYLQVEAAQRIVASYETGASIPLPAFSIDDGDLFHVRPDARDGAQAGVPVPCRLDLLAGPPRNSERVVGDDDGDDERLLVRLWPSAEGLAGDAMVRSQRQTATGPLTLFEIRAELGSRARGLLETDVLRGRTVAVVGLGSGGSPVALALAQAGVGRMILIDNDRLEVANVARHVCGVADVGRYKTRAVADLLRGKNPFIELRCEEFDITRESGRLERAIAGADLIVAATDSDASRFGLNSAALALGIPALFGRALSRASGGDVLRVRPHAGPCLACIFTKQFLETRPREYTGFAEAQAAFPAYTSVRDIEAVVHVGLACDIAPIANMITRLALLELSRGSGGGLDGLDQDLTCDFYTWANRREGVFKALGPMGDFIDEMSILRWYGAAAGRRPECLVCGGADSDPDDTSFGPRA